MKKNRLNLKIFTIYFFTFCLVVSCKKEDTFLGAKPNQSLTVPSTLADFQLLLNNEGLFNQGSAGSSMGYSEQWTISDVNWANGLPFGRNSYIWNLDGSLENENPEWVISYGRVFYANVVLDGLHNIAYTSAEQTKFNEIKGAALFIRSMAFFNLLQCFSLPYDAQKSTSLLGVPLRLSSDLNIKSVRATQQTCYDQIIADLKQAVDLLPATTVYNTQPNKQSANGLLARVFLSKGDYENSLLYSDAGLKMNADLTDYNTLTTGPYTLTNNPNQFLDEDIYHSISPQSLMGLTKAIVDQSLYNLYENNDLRKTYFFTTYNSILIFKGSYDVRSGFSFSGIGRDEVYLTRAESYARLGNAQKAMDDVNALLVNRYKQGTFVSKTALDAEDALKQVLVERKKELCFRGLRWMDLRRLNSDPRFAETLTRTVNGVTYTLPPNSPKYAAPIPDSEIKLSGIQQNQQ